MRKFFIILALLFISSMAHAETWLDGKKVADAYYFSNDLEVGTNSIDGDATAGLGFDPDNDGVNETTIEITGKIITTSDNIALKPTATYTVCSSTARGKDACDYTCDGTDDDVQIQAAIDASGGGIIHLSKGTFNIGDITLPSNTSLFGSGDSATVLNYTGANEAFENPTPGTRIYNWNIQNFILSTSSGSTGFLLDSVSTSSFNNLTVSGFSGAAFDIYSPTAGYSIYNRFYDTTANSVGEGYIIRGVSSNANTFTSCRVNVATNYGFQIIDSNNNTIAYCQIESSSGNGVDISQTVAGRSTGNSIISTRLEGAMTTGVNIQTGVASTIIINPFFSGISGNDISDSGTSTVLADQEIRFKRTHVDLILEGTNDTVSESVSTLHLIAPVYRAKGVWLGATDAWFAGVPYASSDNIFSIGSGVAMANSILSVNTSGSVSIGGTALTSGPFQVSPPAEEIIAGAAVITANACGTIKKISTDDGGAVTTNTTNTFTAPAAANEGCCMDVVNTGTVDTVTLDNNALFFSAGAANVVLGVGDSARVCSDAAAWYQIGATGNN